MNRPFFKRSTDKKIMGEIIMKEKLQKILNDYLVDIELYKNEKDRLITLLGVYQKHGFSEEERITVVKYEAINLVIYKWDNMYREMQEILNK